jgi:WD40 repeat protein
LSELSNNRIVSLDISGSIRIWNYLNGSLISSFNTGLQQRSLEICRNGDYAVGAFNNGLVGIYDATTYNFKHNLIGDTARQVFRIIQLDNDGLSSSSDDFTIKVWDLNTKKLKLNLIGHDNFVRSIIQLHNGYLACGGWDYKVIIYLIYFLFLILSS